MPRLKSKCFAIALLVISTMSISCEDTKMVRVPPDYKWHSMYSIQIPNVSLEFEIERTSDTAKPECRERREPLTTQIRIVQLNEFPNYDNLPDKPEDVHPSSSGVPVVFRDSGPLDLTGVKAKRLISLITGKEILVRTKDPCAVIRVHLLKPKQRAQQPQSPSN